MKVWFVTHYGAAGYGSNLSLLNLLDGLRGTGIQPRVLMPEAGDLGTELTRLGVPFLAEQFRWWVTPRPRPLAGVWRLVRNLRVLPGMAARLAADGCDLVYTNSSVIGFGTLLARRLRRPHVWHLREFVNRGQGYHFDWGHGALRRSVARSAASICVSRAVQDHHVPAPARERSRVVYNGVLREAEFDRWRAAREAGRTGRGDEFTMVLVGLIAPFKGQSLAIEALAGLRRAGCRARLILVGGGDGAYADHCRQLAAESGVADQVEWWGYRKDVLEAYARADAALGCSPEGIGRVAFEAMAAGLPLIALNAGAAAEHIHHERTGLLFTGGPAELAGCLRRLMDEPALADRLGGRAWTDARQRFTVERCAAEVRAVLLRAAAGSPAPEGAATASPAQ